VKLGREVIWMHKSQIQELQDAANEHRQPSCVLCHRPLNVVIQPADKEFQNYYDPHDYTTSGTRINTLR